MFSKSEILRTFLLAAQQESAGVSTNEVTFDVHLLNGSRLPIKCLTTDNSSKILELACTELNLPRDYTFYFALFLLCKDTAGEVVIKRRLMDFEAPYITQSNLGTGHKCVLRKCYWDAAYDQELMRDPVALNLLYIQTVSDNERWPVVAETSPQTRDELASLQSRGNKKEYLEIARNLPNYGTMVFTGCTVDYPERNTSASVILGNKEIHFQTLDAENGRPTATVQETKFRVTRIRCWKITTIQNVGMISSGTIQITNSSPFPFQPGDTPILELSFEFLMSKNYLKWITVRSDKVMIMTVCLQSLVNELLNQKSDTNNLRISSNVNKANTRICFLKRDATNQFRPCEDAKPSTEPVPNNVEPDMDRRRPSRSTDYVKQKLKDISTTVFFKNGQNRVHNEAFEGIGDDDL